MYLRNNYIDVKDKTVVSLTLRNIEYLKSIIVMQNFGSKNQTNLDLELELKS